MRRVDKYWSKLYAGGRDFRTISPEAISHFLSFVKNSTTKLALDVGCGTGELARELHSRHYQTLGIDASTEAIRIAESFNPTSNDTLNYLHFDIEHGDLQNLPAHSYDLITCKLVYAFIDSKPAFLKRIKTLLAPSGIFVVITPLPSDVPLDKRDVAVDESELIFLGKNFQQIALYKEDGLTYFVGKQFEGQ